MDHRRGRGPVPIELHGIDANHEDEVASGDPLVELRAAEPFDRSDAERVVVAQQPLRLGREDRRDPPRLDHLAQRNAHRVVEGVEPGEEHRPRARAQERDRRLQGPRIRSAAGACLPDIRRGGDRGLLGRDVARHLEEDGATTGPRRDAERALGHGRGVGRAHPRLPLRDRREQRAQVELLMGHDLVPVDRQLAGERDDRRAVQVRVRHAGDEVGRARSEGRETRPGQAGAARHRLGHERRIRLVLREDELETRLAEALDEVDDLSTGVTEDVADARGAEAIADDPSDA
jgi:hypothetical protein